MRHYEVMVILDAGLEEDAIRATIDRASQLLTGRGATVDKVDRWGKRRFAYEVRHRSEGYYVLIDTTAEPPAMFDLDRMLRLADDVIRHKITRLPDKAIVKIGSRSSGTEPSVPEPNENGAK
jgi:small subunit ribosomal protein S6